MGLNGANLSEAERSRNTPPYPAPCDRTEPWGFPGVGTSGQSVDLPRLSNADACGLSDGT